MADINHNVVIDKKTNHLTNTQEYNDLITSYNEAISKFISEYPKHVKYDTSEDGYTYITLEYGSVRDNELKEIAELVNNTINDADFKIGDIRCEIIYASDLIIKFKGKTSEVDTDLKNSSNLENLVTKSKVDITIPENLVTQIKDFIENFVEDKYTYTKDQYAKKGITYNKFGTKGHVGINTDIMKKNPSMTEVYTNIGKPITDLLKANPKLITNNLSKLLCVEGIHIERVSANFVMFGYEINVYENEGTGDNGGGGTTPDPNPDPEFEYEKIPGTITRIFIHLGNATETSNITEGKYIDVDGAKRINYNNSRIFKITEIVENVVVPVEITDHNTISDIITNLQSNTIVLEKLCTGKYSYHNTPVYLWTIPEKSDIINDMYISDSKLNIHFGNANDSRLYNLGNGKDTIDNRIDSNDEYYEDEDSEFKNGIAIIGKALETGRALDLVLPLNDVSINEGWGINGNYTPSNYDESGDEFQYTPEEGKITRIYVHFGYGELISNVPTNTYFTDVTGIKRSSKYNSVYRMTNVIETYVIEDELTISENISNIKSHIVNSEFKDYIKTCNKYGAHSGVTPFHPWTDLSNFDDLEDSLWIANSLLTATRSASIFSVRDPSYPNDFSHSSDVTFANIKNYNNNTNTLASNYFDAHAIIINSIETGKPLHVLAPLDANITLNNNGNHNLKYYPEEEIEEEFEYTKTPGTISKLFIRIGLITELDNTAYDFNPHYMFVDRDGANRCMYNAFKIDRLNELEETIVIDTNLTSSAEVNNLWNDIANNNDLINYLQTRQYRDGGNNGSGGEVETPNELEDDSNNEVLEDDGNNEIIEENDDNGGDNPYDSFINSDTGNEIENINELENSFWIADSSLTTSRSTPVDVTYSKSDNLSTIIDLSNGGSKTFGTMFNDSNIITDFAGTLQDGYSVIKKAMETGRALDILLPYNESALSKLEKVFVNSNNVDEPPIDTPDSPLAEEEG